MDQAHSTVQGDQPKPETLTSKQSEKIADSLDG